MSVTAGGLQSDVQKVASASRRRRARLTLSLRQVHHAGTAPPSRMCWNRGARRPDRAEPLVFERYDDIYPTGAGQGCGGAGLHGVPRRELPSGATGDRGGVDLLGGPHGGRGAAGS